MFLCNQIDQIPNHLSPLRVTQMGHRRNPKSQLTYKVVIIQNQNNPKSTLTRRVVIIRANPKGCDYPKSEVVKSQIGFTELSYASVQSNPK